MALVCAVGERLRTDPSLCAHVVGALEGLPIRMVSQAGLPSQHHRRAAVRTTGGSDGAPARPLLFDDSGAPRGERIWTRFGPGPDEGHRMSCRVLVVGHGRMGRLIEALAPDQSIEIAGIVSRDSADALRDRARWSMWTWPSTCPHAQAFLDEPADAVHARRQPRDRHDRLAVGDSTGARGDRSRRDRGRRRRELLGRARTSSTR